MMKLILRSIYITTLISMIVVLIAPAAFGQPQGVGQIETKKRAQTGMKFLSFSVDARSSALGGAVTADLGGGPISMFYNPAGMAWQDNSFQVALSRTQWIADINYNAGAASWRPGDGDYGIFGISVLTVDYGDFLGTIRADTESGYQNTGTFSPSAWALGLAYAKTLSAKFSFGAQVKLASEDLGTVQIAADGATQDNSKTNVVADFGIVYRTGFKSLNFAMTARNFSSEVKYAEENFELPLTFKIGVNLDLVDLTSIDPEQHSLLLAIDTERPRDFDEQLRIGAEYTYSNLVSLRAGYFTPSDEESFSLGAGLKKDFDSFGFSLDYSYTSFGVFDNVSRFMLKFSF